MAPRNQFVDPIQAEETKNAKLANAFTQLSSQRQKRRYMLVIEVLNPSKYTVGIIQ